MQSWIFVHFLYFVFLFLFLSLPICLFSEQWTVFAASLLFQLGVIHCIFPFKVINLNIKYNYLTPVRFYIIFSFHWIDCDNVHLLVVVCAWYLWPMTFSHCKCFDYVESAKFIDFNSISCHIWKSQIPNV